MIPLKEAFTRLFRTVYTHNIIYLSTFLGLAGFGCQSVQNERAMMAHGTKLSPAERKHQLRIARKYDLLEKELLQEHERSVRSDSLFVKLYAVMELAEFYSNKFINFSQALDYWKQARALNELLKYYNSQKQFELDSKRHVVVQAGHEVPRKYTFQTIEERIKNQQDRLRSIMQGIDEQKLFPFSNDRTKLPYFEISELGEYANVLIVDPQVCDPTLFDVIENKFFNATKGHFEHRHKLTQQEKEYYTLYNVTRALIRVFDFADLTEPQIHRVLTLTGQTSAKIPDNVPLLETVYLDYCTALCMSHLGRNQEAIEAFERFDSAIKGINDELQRISDEVNSRIKKDHRKALATGALTLTFDIMLAVATKGQWYGKTTTGTIQKAYNDMISAERELLLRGESSYSKGLNVCLGLNEQLAIFRAIGKSYFEENNFEKSIRYNSESVRIINNMRTSISSEHYRISFARYKDDVYCKLIESLMALGKGRQAFEVSEEARSRAFVDLLGSRRITEANSAKNLTEKFDLLAEQRLQIYEDHLRQQTKITDAQVNYLVKLRSRELPSRGMKLVSGVQADMLSQSEKKEHQKISLMNMERPNTDNIQSLLPNDVTLVEYYLAHNSVFAWILTKDNLLPVRLEIKPSKLEEELYSFSQMVSAGLTISIDSDKFRHISHRLYTSLFQPLRNQIHTKRVYMVNHRNLHFFPIEMLYDGHEYIVKNYSISYLPSASVLQYLPQQHSKFRSLLALGNPTTDYAPSLSPLSGAEDEVRDIATLVSSGKVYLGSKASETVFKKQSANYDIIHLASHGEFDSNEPLQSRLYLSRDKENDGILTANELYATRIDASLVTLSACQSGVSAVRNGDELIGLLRGFFFAGTSSVISSLWKVDDSATNRFMKIFYRSLLEDNLELGEALQLTKTKLIKIGEFDHPYFWAAFILTGHGWL